MEKTVNTPWLTIKEAAEFLRISPRTLSNNLCQYPNSIERTPPSHGKGKARRFHRDELTEWQKNR